MFGLRINKQWRGALAAMALLVSLPVLAQDPLADPEATRELLESGIAAAQAATDLDEEARTSVLELYRQAVEQLEAAQVNRLAAEGYQTSIETAPTEAAGVRAALSNEREADPLATLELDASDAVEELDQRLQAEMANLASAEGLLEELKASLEAEAERPTLARERTAEARQLIEAQGETAPAVSESVFASEARRWWNQLRTAALETEIRMLEQELLSQRARLDLLNARHDAAELTVAHAGMRVDRLTDELAVRRRSVADEALEQATATLDETTAAHPLVQQTAEANLLLVAQLQTQVSELELVAEQSRDAQLQLARISTAFRSATRKLELDRFGAPLGQAIREERQLFPNVDEFRSARRDVQDRLATASLRLIESQDEVRSLGSVERYVDGTTPDPELGDDEREEVAVLLESRQDLLQQSVANDEAYQQRLYALDDLLIQLDDTLAAYDGLLAQQLFRVRSSRAIYLTDFGGLPGDLAIQFSPTAWWGVIVDLLSALFQAPGLTLLLIGGVALFTQTRRLRIALEATGSRAARESLLQTVKALGLAAILASRWPILVLVLGWLLMAIDEPTQFTTVVATALVNMADTLWLFILYAEVFSPHGPARTQFRWSRDALTLFHARATIFIAIFAPVLFIANVWFFSAPGTMGGALGLLELAALLFLLAWVFWRALEPTRGPLRGYFHSHRHELLARARYVWIPVVVLTPVVLVILHAVGFRYAALEIVRRIVDSLWLVLGLLVIAGFAERWLLMARRRLMHEAATREREAAAMVREEASARTDEDLAVDPELNEIGAETDLLALDAGSRKLLVAGLSVLAFVGFFVIWADLLPALTAFDNLTLWSRPVMIDGVEQSVAVTGQDILIATVIGLLGYVAARDFPALLEIILLRYDVISAGSRYAVTTLSRYTIVTVAVLAVLGMLGASWSQMGWAVAALSVGIGFGLQEIVANFISGLILLFERPIRVGDVVTIGDATGVVTRIRIRATTVRDWDRKELIVPNKEFITGRLLNWTLSDPVTRLVVSVGVAYGSDVETAMTLMREIAEENEYVLDDPAPFVTFEQFADSSLTLTLRAWVGSFMHRLQALTELHQAINEKFNAAGIVIAFPQQDVHVYSHNPYDAFPADKQ